MNKNQTNIVGKTRPQSIDSLVGVEYIKSILRYDIEGSLKLQEPMANDDRCTK
jgi:hypothetical protein